MKRREVVDSNAPSRWQRVKRSHPNWRRAERRAGGTHDASIAFGQLPMRVFRLTLFFATIHGVEETFSAAKKMTG